MQYDKLTLGARFLTITPALHTVSSVFYLGQPFYYGTEVFHSDLFHAKDHALNDI